MKKIVQLLIIIFAIGFCNIAFTQTINICGSDTIVLTAGNYQNGTIQWEESIDNITWSDVDSETDTVYRFFPIANRYIRALARFSGCPSEYSEVSYVQLLPKANAGADRTLSANSVQMIANSEEGAEGVWDIISGVGGSFSDINNPYAIFQGNDSTYNLVWSLSNTCGTSSDTIEIKIVQNEYKNVVAVVDLTDNMISDSTQMANGLYIIKFSIPAPIITDSTVLVGLAGEGFIRKVDSFTSQNDTISIHTSQGSLTDITVNGVFNLGDVNDISTSSNKSSSGYYKLDHMPTRVELSTDPKFKTGRYVYLVEDKVTYIRPGVSYRGNTNKSSAKGDPLINLTFSETLWENDNASFKLSGYYKFDPNIVVDFDINTKWYGKPYLNSFKAGMYNGTIKSNFKIEFEASAAAELLDKSFVIFSKKKTSVFVIGAVPVTVTSRLAFEGSIAVNADANLNITHEQTHIYTYTSAIEYHKGDWSFPRSKTESSKIENTVEISGNLTQNFEIGPTISFKVYGVVGPYVQMRLTEELTLCAGADLEGAGWQGNVNIGGNITVGAKAEVASINLFNIKKTWSKGFYHLQFPSKIGYVSGNNQSYEKDVQLAQKLTVKAKSNKGFVIPGTIVHFIPKSGGSVSDAYVLANGKGEASTYWTPGGESTSTMEAVARDCDGNNLNKSPISFFATSNSVGLACANSSLSASLKFFAPKEWYKLNYYKLEGNLGAPPYNYSTNGLDYSSTAPRLYSSTYKLLWLNEGKTYMYYVKDNNGCVAITSYTVGSCKNSSLAVNTEVAGNVIFANASGGSAPYTYAVDDVNGNYTTENTFINLYVGNHIFYVKDDGGCISSKIEYLPAAIPPIIADFTSNKLKAAPGITIEFLDLSNNATSWLWDFGDGTTSDVQDPEHSYTAVGNYSVKLVSSNATSTATLIKSNLIQVGLIPEAKFTADITSLNLGESVSFTNQSDNSPTSVLWDFGDGNTSSSFNPTHTYSSLGSYAVKLTATNVYGFNTLIQEDYINVVEATTFIDARDGHTYNFVKIGNQTWMTANLAWLPSVSSPLAEDYWDPTSMPKYFVYEYLGNDVEEAKASDIYLKYGVYYNVPATEFAAPEGWHIPTAAEWQELIDYVAANGYEGSEGNALKSCRQVLSPLAGDCATDIHPRWDQDEVQYGNDAFGFSALPAAEASAEMGFLGGVGMWWGRSTDSSTADVPFFTIESNSSAARLDKWDMTVLGLSIRCIKD